jgi:serine/threonine-protein phosphatase PP1 catalytic subunit
MNSEQEINIDEILEALL